VASEIVDSTLKDAEHRMKQALEATHRDFATVRTGRANPSLLDKITVDYYGTLTPLNQLATISVPESRLLVVSPWDKSIIGAIRNSITKSDLGLNPIADKEILRIPLPPLTEERRKELSRLVGKKAEDSKVAIRNIRRDIIEELRKKEKSHELSEDELKRAQESVQKLTDRYIQELDKLHDTKVQEIMEV
jgi:ribosome recycling factor